MPRIVSTTWFEDLGYMNQPMFDMKIARLSLRQLVYLVIFAVLSYFIYMSLPFLSMMYRAIFPVAVFAVGMGLFARKGKVFAPEWYLMYFIKQRLSGRGNLSSETSPGEEEEVPEKPVGSRLMTAPMGKPTRIAGVLYNPSTGERMSNTSYEVLMGGEPYHAGRTDQDGAYSLVFTPPGLETYVLTIRPKGHSKAAEEIKVSTKAMSETSGREGELEESRTVSREALGAESGSESGASRTEKRENHVYELFPMNFADLSDNDQDALVNSYRGLLNSLPVEREVKIYAVRSSKEVSLGEQTVEPEYFRFFIESEDPLDAKLDSFGFQYQRTTENPGPEIARGFKDSVAIKGGKSLRVATICELGSRLIEGFPHFLYRNADVLVMKVKRLEQGNAVRKMDKFTRMQQGLVMTGKTSRQEEVEARRAQEAINRLTEEGSRLFEATINIAVGGSTREEMDDNYDRMESTCNGRMVEVDDPMFVQEEMLKGDLGKELIVDTVTLGAFFPFVSADVMETPGGVFLGVNRRTGSPVLFDPYVRSNQNLAMIGTSGSGKSYASKLYLTRLFDKHPDMAYFVIDPENEYTRTCDELDPTTEVIHVSRNARLGLDPLKIFKGSKEIAMEMLIDLLSISDDEPNLLSKLRIGVGRANSLEELKDQVGGELGERIEGILEGTTSFLFQGESAELPERTVINLKPLHEALRLTESRAGTLHTASLLLFGQIWNKIENLPLEKPKVVVVDEVWLYTGLPASASFLEQVSRRGRKRNVIFLLASQRPGDVLGSEGARAALENCATKVIFQQDEAAKNLVGESFGLTTKEVNASTDFSPGQAIIKGGDVKVPIKFAASELEHMRFTTKPREGV